MDAAARTVRREGQRRVGVQHEDGDWVHASVPERGLGDPTIGECEPDTAHREGWDLVAVVGGARFGSSAQAAFQAGRLAGLDWLCGSRYAAA